MTAPPLGDAFSVEIVHDARRLIELRADWERLWREDASADLFCSFDWLSALHATFGKLPGPATLAYHDGRGRQAIEGGPWSLRIHVVRDVQGTAVALLPLVRVVGLFNGRRRQLLSLPTNSQSMRSGILATRFDAAVATAIVRALKTQPDWEVLVLDGLPAANRRLSILAERLAAAGRVSAFDGTWPGAYMRCEGTMEDYFAGGDRSHFRRSLVKATNSLRKAGALSVQCYGADRVDEGLSLFLQVDARSWKAKSGEAVSHHPVLQSFYADLCGRLAASAQLEIWVLYVAEVAAAAFICPHDGRARYTLKSSFSDGFGASRSPTLVLFRQVVQQTWGIGAPGIDFVGKQPFLDRWATQDLMFESRSFYRSRTALRREHAADGFRLAMAGLRALPGRVWRRSGMGRPVVAPPIPVPRQPAEPAVEA